MVFLQIVENLFSQRWLGVVKIFKVLLPGSLFWGTTNGVPAVNVTYYVGNITSHYISPLLAILYHAILDHLVCAQLFGLIG